MNTSRRRTRAWIGSAAVLSMTFAACSSSDGDSTESPTGTEATESPEATDAPGSSDAPSDPDDPDAPADSGPPVELTASARGVTADTITIGYSYLDFDELVSLNLTASGRGDQEATFQTAVDAVNESGGILGRSIEVIYRPYSALGTAGAEAVCLEFTEDNEVFAVLGGFVGPAEPANTCIVGRGETVLVGGVQSEERLAEATAPWVTDRPLRTRQADILISLLEAEGELEGRTIAVVAGIDAEDVRDEVAAALGAAGAEPAEVLQSEAAVGDILAEDTVWATLAERLRGANVDTILLVGNPSAGVRNAAAQGLDVDIWALDQESLTSLGNTVDLEDARGALAAAPLTGQDLWEHESMAVCRDAFTAGLPDVDVIDPADLAEGDEDWARGIGFGCRFLKIFEAIATEAGADLTPESFATAVAALTEFSVPGAPFASLGTKFDANDSFALVSFNPDIGAEGGFDNLTEIQDVTP